MTNEIFTAKFVNPFTGKEHEYSYWTDISTTQKALFAQFVVGAIVTDDFYNGLLKDMIVKRTIIALFTDVPIGSKEDEDFTDDMIDVGTIEKSEIFVEQSGIVETVMEHMKPGVMAPILKSIDDNIEYKTGIQQHGFEKSVTELVEKLTEKVSAMDVDSLNTVLGKVASMQGDFTPENVLNAYMGTDMFKQNVAERENIVKDNEAKILELVKEAKNAIKADKK